MLTETLDSPDLIKEEAALESEEESVEGQEDNTDVIQHLEERRLNMNTTLIRPEQVKVYGNRLTEENSFDRVGSNGIFEILPKIVKFKGFEMNKKVTIKVNVVNKSKFSQRLAFIPPTTPFFKIKYSRKGIIAPGLSEVVYISFYPQNYVYYYDYLRILCEGDKLLLPIHAFPKMNMHQKDYIPKFLDFGTVSINNEQEKFITLKNIIDKPFEYEIVPLKECREIKVEPVDGTIEAFDSKRIGIKIKATSYGFFRSEFEFRLSEMDYQPVLFSVVGSCNVFDKVPSENIIKHMKALKEPDNSLDLPVNRKRNTKIIINEELNYLPSVLANESVVNFVKAEEEASESKVNNINPEFGHSHIVLTEDNKLLNTRPPKEGSPLKQKLTSPRGISKKYKIFPSNKEREFLNYYNRIDNTCKDKEIKYIRFIGKKLPTDSEVDSIVKGRVKELEDNLFIRRKVDLSRHSFEADTEKSLVDRSNNYLIKPTFDFNQNDKFFKTRHYFNIFLKNLTKVVINRRADDRLKKIKEMVTQNNIRSAEDFGNLVQSEWTIQVKGREERNDFELKFVAPKCVQRSQVYLSYDYNIDSFKQQIDHQNNIDLEESNEFNSLERSEVEVINYKEFKSNGVTLYEVSTEDKVLRTCGENENAIRGQRGDLELSYEKTASLFEMPESFRTHIETPAENLLFPNPNFNKFVSFNKFAESAIDYNLQPREILDWECNDMPRNFSYELHSKLSLSIYDNLPIRTLNNSIGDSGLNLIPNKLDKQDQRELYIKMTDTVDEDNYIFDLKEDDDKLLLEFEKDDEVIRSVRESNKDEVVDLKKKEKINLESLLKTQKKKWASTLPTVIDYFNSGLSNPNNKFII